MKAKRILFTGLVTAHLMRHVEYAIGLGASVLHVGFDSLYPDNSRTGYSFASIAEEATLAMRLRKERGPAVQEMVAHESQRLAAMVEEFRPNLCHAIGIDLALDLCIAAKVRPIVVSALGFLSHWVYEKAQLKEGDRFLTEVDALVLEAPVMVEIARRLLPATVRVEECGVGVDCRRFHPVDGATRANWRRALNLPPEALVILSPRGWARGYNHEYIVEAFAQALPYLPRPVHLLFITSGRTGDVSKSLAYLDEVKEMAERLGVAGHIRWLPAFPRETVATLYNAADLVISYTTPDTFSNSVLEIMACARPLIAPDLPTYSGSVIAEHCRLATPKDAGALAETILDMVHNPPSSEVLAAGREAILAHYDKPVVMQQLASIYDDVISI